jgi:hypothetical protein
MDFNAAIDIIIKDLNEIRDIVDDFTLYPEVPRLKVEILKAKCKYAGEIMELLKAENISRSAQPGDKAETVSVASPLDLTELIEEEPAVKKDEEPVITGKNIINTVQPATGKGDDISSVIKSIPVSDLASVIRMNERFLFIKNIFGGSAASYEEAIGKLNRSESVSDAKAIIMSYTGDSKESEAVSHLMDIVKRKFPANG